MSRRNAAIFDDESGKGLGKVKKCSKGGDDKVTFVVVGRPLVPTPLSFQNGGIVLETEFFLQTLAVTKTLLCRLSKSRSNFRRNGVSVQCEPTLRKQNGGSVS